MSPFRPSQLIDRLRRFLQQGDPLVQLKALLLLVIGWLLSPLCWWNDLVFNLPLAWGVGKLLALWKEPWFAPGLVLGYWLSNVAGIVMMQSSALAVFQDGDQPRNPRRDLLVGLATSTLYTLAIVALVKTGVLSTPLGDLTSAGQLTTA